MSEFGRHALDVEAAETMLRRWAPMGDGDAGWDAFVAVCDRRQALVAGRLTHARELGLRALVCAPEQTCRVTNTTDVAASYVYWRTARWLIRSGYASKLLPLQSIRLTVAGAELAVQLGILPEPA